MRFSVLQEINTKYYSLVKLIAMPLPITNWNATKNIVLQKHQYKYIHVPYLAWDKYTCPKQERLTL